MPKPERSIDEAGVRAIAGFSGIALDDDRVAVQLEFLKGQIETLRTWDAMPMGFNFSDGEFTFVRPAVVYRPPWEYPAPINKHRVAGGA